MRPRAGVGADGLAWASQMVPEASGLLLSPSRLVAIDLDTGVGTVVPTPEGRLDIDASCISDGVVHAGRADIDGAEQRLLASTRPEVEALPIIGL